MGSTREFGLTVRSMFVVRLVITWHTRDRIRIWWEKEKEKERLPTSLFVRLKKLSRRQDLKKQRKNNIITKNNKKTMMETSCGGRKLFHQEQIKKQPKNTRNYSNSILFLLSSLSSLSSLFSLLSLSLSL